MIKFWCICIFINLLLFYLLRNEAIDAVKTDPRSAAKCKKMTEAQIERTVHLIMLLVAFTGPLFWVYVIINMCKEE